MKLHNLLLTAALFLTASIASAAVIHEYDEGNDLYDSKDVETSAEQKIHAYVTDFTKNNYSYHFSYFLGDANGNWVSDELKIGNNTVLKPAGVEDITVLIKATLYNDHVLDFDSAYNSLQTFDTTHKLSFIGGDVHNIKFGDNGYTEGVVTFGSPLPTPVVTLLIALGFGAAFMMYRNRKQVKA